MSWTEADLREYVAAIEELQRIERKLVDGGLLFDDEMITCNSEFGAWANGRILRLRTLYEPLNYEAWPEVYYNDGTMSNSRNEFGPSVAGWYWHIGRHMTGGAYATEAEAREQYDNAVRFNQRFSL